ncbi:MAG TPA: hypothetical protein VGA64_10930 [Candidatus Polarisedimenticolia bacterium]
MGRPTSVSLLACTALLAGSCATVEKNANVVGTFSDKLSPYNYREEGKVAILVAGVEAARFIRDEPFVPIIVQVANKSKATFQITRESFVLEDTLGRSYPLAEAPEVAARYGRLDLDHRLLIQNRSFTSTGVSLFTYIESNFFPSSTRRALLIQQVTLPPTTYMEDLLYFPVPETGLNDVPLRLLFKPKELEEPVQVVFEVPKTIGILEKKKGSPKKEETQH